MTTLVKTNSTYREGGRVGLSIRFSAIVLIHEDEDGPYTEPLLDLQHYEMLLAGIKATPKRARPFEIRSQIKKLYNESYLAATRINRIS